MRSLLIDTSQNNMVVSIVEDNNILYKFEELIEKDMAAKILPIIRDGFRSVNFDINDIDKIFIVNGPGSFTGVRVGVTIAKTMAWSLKKYIIPISSLELMATTKTSKKYLVPLIDARRGNVFAGIYDRDLNIIKKDSLISLEELTSNLNEDYELISYDDIKNSLKPSLDILKIINKYKSDTGVNPHNLNPNYLKLTEAEENLGVH